MLRVLPALPCLLLLSLPGHGFASDDDDDDTRVLTTSGPIRGKRLPAGSDTVTAFLGVPYAEPPVGTLRFQKPVPHRPWRHVLEATNFGHACFQSPPTGLPLAEIYTPKTPQSEDCLFLNLWVPHPRPNGTAPIMVWIHGGGYVSGAASLDVYDGRLLATTGNVIVSSINYRLGALGFLCLPPAAPGNAGLWDQHLALRWLQDNAAAFGGDPAEIMLFGQDAGAASVGFHLLSPWSRPLFARASLVGGAPNAPGAWLSSEESQERAQRLGQLMGCSNGTSTALVGCLRGKEPREFPLHQFSVLDHKALMQLPFLPTVDGDFLSDTPPRLLQAQQGPPKTIGVGFSANEGSYLLLFFAHALNHDNGSLISWDKLLQMLRLLAPEAPEMAIQAVARLYGQAGEEEGEARYRWAMEEILGDYFVVCPLLELSRLEAKAGNPVYTAYFAHRTSGLSTPAWTGVGHGTELPYIFGTLGSVVGTNYTEAEAMLSRTGMRYLGTFARSGKPILGEEGSKQWPSYDPGKQNFEHIGLKPVRVERMSHASYCAVLASLLSEKPSVPAEISGLSKQQP
ncbi:acetylcholinesterase-like [Carettochelys insculpta]|uniref:acetylcholinesterase-like n=1 Tax=Carettochelys insculpta TaxID=44489 RepID=UPI003EB936BF